jgi:hypothetical protein
MYFATTYVFFATTYMFFATIVKYEIMKPHLSFDDLLRRRSTPSTTGSMKGLHKCERNSEGGSQRHGYGGGSERDGKGG